MPQTTVPSKSLSILEDQLHQEFLACKKAEHYAQTFENPQLRDLAGDLAQQHRQRFDRLFGYLNSHG